MNYVEVNIFPEIMKKKNEKNAGKRGIVCRKMLTKFVISFFNVCC